jgi:hypothetical protein
MKEQNSDEGFLLQFLSRIIISINMGFLFCLPSDIYLVREGVVNDYALKFVVNVPNHTSDRLRFGDW